MRKGIIEIENMEFYAFHGCYREEQLVGNRFMVDLTLETDIEAAAESDNVGDTVNYLEVYQAVRSQMEVRSDILEHVGYRILEEIKKRFPKVLSAKVKVSKCNPPLGGMIERVSVSQSF